MSYTELEKERQKLLPTHDHRYFMIIAPPPTWKHWSRVMGECLQEEIPISPSLISNRQDLDLYFFRREDTGRVLCGDTLFSSRLLIGGPPQD
jgi:hypothetical protein